MADLGDVTALLASMAAAAVYPNGTSAPSIAGVPVKIFEGWPLAATLDTDITAGAAQVSIYPMGGGSSGVFQVLNEPYIVTPAAHGMTASVVDDAVTLSGTPGVGEFASISVNNATTSAHGGGSIAAILAAILADMTTPFPGVAVSGDTITFPPSAHSLVCNIGAPATAEIVTHRQKEPVTITVWAPTPALRNALAAAVSVAFKAVNHLTFPDTSLGVMCFSHERQSDERQTASIYRRDMVFEVEYATLDIYPVVEITSFNATLDGGPSLIGHVADDLISTG